MTNFEKIKQDDEGLMEVLACGGLGCESCIYDSKQCNATRCSEGIKAWLNKEAKE